MKALARLLLALSLPLSAAGSAAAATAEAGDTIAIQEMKLTVPEGWSLKQDAKDAGTIILGFQNADDYLTIYVKRASGLNMRQIFVNGSQVVRDVRNAPRNSYPWQVLETSKTLGTGTVYVASFLTELNGYSYYGYSRSNSSASALANVNAFLQDLR